MFIQNESMEPESLLLFSILVFVAKRNGCRRRVQEGEGLECASHSLAAIVFTLTSYHLDALFQTTGRRGIIGNAPM